MISASLASGSLLDSRTLCSCINGLSKTGALWQSLSRDFRDLIEDSICAIAPNIPSSSSSSSSTSSSFSYPSSFQGLTEQGISTLLWAFGSMNVVYNVDLRNDTTNALIQSLIALSPQLTNQGLTGSLYGN